MSDVRYMYIFSIDFTSKFLKFWICENDPTVLMSNFQLAFRAGVVNGKLIPGNFCLCWHQDMPYRAQVSNLLTQDPCRLGHQQQIITLNFLNSDQSLTCSNEQICFMPENIDFRNLFAPDSTPIASPCILVNAESAHGTWSKVDREFLTAFLLHKSFNVKLLENLYNADGKPTVVEIFDSLSGDALSQYLIECRILKVVKNRGINNNKRYHDNIMTSSSSSSMPNLENETQRFERRYKLRQRQPPHYYRNKRLGETYEEMEKMVNDNINLEGLTGQQKTWATFVYGACAPRYEISSTENKAVEEAVKVEHFSLAAEAARSDTTRSRDHRNVKEKRLSFLAANNNLPLSENLHTNDSLDCLTASSSTTKTTTTTTATFESEQPMLIVSTAVVKQELVDDFDIASISGYDGVRLNCYSIPFKVKQENSSSPCLVTEPFQIKREIKSEEDGDDSALLVTEGSNLL